MSVMWPSERMSIPSSVALGPYIVHTAQRRCYGKLRNDLIQCCVSAGIRVPGAIPIPGLPADMNGTMIPSMSLAHAGEASAPDILMAPLD